MAFQIQLDGIVYLALTMGFLGGFSTLSTMNFEAVELVSQRHYAEGLGYLARPTLAPLEQPHWASP